MATVAAAPAAAAPAAVAEHNLIFRTAFDAACGPITFAPDGTHDAPPCNCSDGHGGWSKWNLTPRAARFVGRAPTFLPYFYYQTPMDTYPGSSVLGYFYSTPAGGASLSTRIPCRMNVIDMPIVASNTVLGAGVDAASGAPSRFSLPMLFHVRSTRRGS